MHCSAAHASARVSWVQINPKAVKCHQRVVPVEVRKSYAGSARHKPRCSSGRNKTWREMACMNGADIVAPNPSGNGVEEYLQSSSVSEGESLAFAGGDIDTSVQSARISEGSSRPRRLTRQRHHSRHSDLQAGNLRGRCALAQRFLERSPTELTNLPHAIASESIERYGNVGESSGEWETALETEVARAQRLQGASQGRFGQQAPSPHSPSRC